MEEVTTNYSTMATEFITPLVNTHADKVIGSILSLCMIIGIPGNIVALVYFWPRRYKSVHDMLYSIVIATDASTCIATFPVVIVFVDERMPFMFDSAGVCASWTVVFGILMRFSMFTVVMISVTRTISIVCPFHKIKVPVVLVACFGYAAWLIGKEAIFIGMGLWQFDYFKFTGYCVRGPSEKGQELWKQYDVYSYLLQIEFIGPFLIIFISLILSLFALLTRKKYKSSRDKKFWKVSITITLFTGVFMFCNFAVLAHNVFQLMALYIDDIISFSIMKKSFFYWYRFVLSHVFCTVLNSTVNPLLYLLRMPQYQKWLNSFIKHPNGSYRWATLVVDGGYDKTLKSGGL